MKMRSQEIISALVYLCVFRLLLIVLLNNSDETIYLLFEPHTQTYIYIERHTHDHTFSLSAHASTRVSRAAGSPGLLGPRRYRRRGESLLRGCRVSPGAEMARSAGKNKKRERAETPCD